MGTNIELNDTLQLTVEQGFPCDVLNYEKHKQSPITLDTIKDMVFEFSKEDARVFHLDPVRVFLVQNIDGKWLFWGHALIQSQEIKKLSSENWKAGEWQTSGTFKISAIYEPEFQKQATSLQSPPGKSFF